MNSACSNSEKKTTLLWKERKSERKSFTDTFRLGPAGCVCVAAAPQAPRSPFHTRPSLPLNRPLSAVYEPILSRRHFTELWRELCANDANEPWKLIWRFELESTWSVCFTKLRVVIFWDILPGLRIKYFSPKYETHFLCNSSRTGLICRQPPKSPSGGFLRENLSIGPNYPLFGVCSAGFVRSKVRTLWLH